MYMYVMANLKWLNVSQQSSFQTLTGCLETAIAPPRVYEVVHFCQSTKTMVSPTDWWVNT